MSSFLENLKRFFFGQREDGRDEVDSQSQRSCSPPRAFEQRSPTIPSIQPRHTNESDYWNENPVFSARESRPKQPETTPARLVTPTPRPSPPVLQRGFVDSTRAPAVSIPSPKPYALSCLEPAKKPPSSYGSDLPETHTGPSGTQRKPTVSSSPYALEKPSVPFVLDPPKRLSVPTASESPKEPSGSSVPANWRPTNVLPVYSIPADIKRMIEKDEVPEVLRKPLSPSTYADHFAALLYAEDYYMEKWSDFLEHFVLSGVTLTLREETSFGKSRESGKTIYMDQRDDTNSDRAAKKIYVEFDMDSIPEKRPFLLSRDYVYVRRSGKGKDVKPFQGFLWRVVKSSHLWAEFGNDFHSQHSSTYKYDVWFDFNRVCLKRSHHGVAAAVNPSFRCMLFPDTLPRSRRQIPTFTIPFDKNFNQAEISAIYQILGIKGPPPYLIEGPSPRIHLVINEAVIQIYKTRRDSRILIVTPQNKTCDSLMRDLKKEIPDAEMFRANAAFRERDDVPIDILSSSLYEGECFTCPPPQDLKKFEVISSTFMSSFRLHCHGICAGHFSHIFVVDACDVTEPETMVTLANLADESTVVVLTGASERYTRWVRADIARANGLRRSYFERLLESEPYSSRDPGFVMYL